MHSQKYDKSGVRWFHGYDHRTPDSLSSRQVGMLSAQAGKQVPTFHVPGTLFSTNA
jgi:hypothetical protein